MKNTYMARALLSADTRRENSLHSELEYELEHSPERKSLLLKRMSSPLKKRRPNIRQTGWRWLALILVCIVNFGLYYCYNTPQPIQPIIQSEFKISESTYNLLYSVYSFPNIILPFFGGYLADHLGVRVTITLFGMILVVGQAVQTIGAYLGNFNVIIAGRFIFGLGGENLIVSQLPMISTWFSTTELSFAWGVGRAAIRIGSSLNSFFTPKIYLWSGQLYVPFLVGAIVSLCAWLGGLTFAFMDKYADKQEAIALEEIPKRGKVNFKDLKSLPSVFYLLLLNYPCLYGGFFGLSNNINNMMVQRLGFNVSEVGSLVMIIYLVAAAVGPFFGPLIDKYGRRIRVMFIISVLFLVTELTILFLKDKTSADPNYGIIGPLIGLSTFYAVYSIVFWPCVPLIVDKKILGTVSGIITAVFNLMLTVFPIVLGVIHDKTLNIHHGYFWTEIAISIVIALGVLTTIWIHFEDARTGGKLDKSPHEKMKELTIEPMKLDDDFDEVISDELVDSDGDK